MTYSKTYVQEDAHGALRVGASDVSLDSVVIAYQQGHSAESIQQLYPLVSLEEVHGTIAFYLANQTEVHRYLDKQRKLWNDLKAKSDQAPSPVVERLRKLSSTGNKSTP